MPANVRTGGELLENGSCRETKEGVKSWFEEQVAPEADLVSWLSTARGLGLTFSDVSRNESRIPRNVRKKTTATVIAFMKIRCLAMYGYLSKISLVLIQPFVNCIQVAEYNLPAHGDRQVVSLRQDYFPRRELLNTVLAGPPDAPGRACCGRPAGLLPG